MNRWILLAIGLGGLLAIPAGARAGQPEQLPTPQLEAQDCAPGDPACVSPRGPLLESDQLECEACGAAPKSNGSSPAGTATPRSSGNGGSDRALLCSMGDMPLGPDIPGCVTPPADLSSVPPL